MNSASAPIIALAAVFAAAVLAMAMLGLIIWRQRSEAEQLREQLALAEGHLLSAGEQQVLMQQEMARMQSEQQEQNDDIGLKSPVEWSTCLSCRSPLQVVLCPHCKSPYHKQWTSPRGKVLNCWEAVLSSGRCWNCKGDLTLFQKIPAAAPPAVPVAALRPAPLPMQAPPAHLTTTETGAGNGGPPVAPIPLPRNLTPTRAEAPPTADMIEERKRALAAKAPTPTKAVTPPTVRLREVTTNLPPNGANESAAPLIPNSPPLETGSPLILNSPPAAAVPPPTSPVIAAAPPPVPAPPAGPLPVTIDPTAELVRPLPRTLTPMRQESPPTPEMLESRNKLVVTPNSTYVVAPEPLPGTVPPPGPPDEDDDFKIM